MYSEYQHTPCYKNENDDLERNLSCKCTVLCFILEYIYIVQIVYKYCTKRRISPVLDLNMQIPDQVKCLVVVACWKQAQDLCVSLYNIYYMLHFWRFLPIENLVGYFELFWRHIYINAPNTAWRYIDSSLQALQTLYWPLKSSGSKEHRFEIMTGTWRYMRRYSWRPENLLVLRCP